MTDQDVVRRAADLMGVRSIFRGQRHPELGSKPVYRATLKCARAVELMLGLRTLMGEQRQVHIDRVLASYAPTHRRLRRPSTCTHEGCGRPTEARGLCHRHYLAFIRANGGRAPRLTLEMLDPKLELSPTPEARRAWLAGLLEGEGTFATQRDGTALVSIEMCARDVVDRAAMLMSAPSVRPGKDPRAEARGWSPTFETKVVSRKAIALMRELRPLMGARRTREIDRALAIVDPRSYVRLVDPPANCVTDGCERKPRGRGLCHRHYMRWLRHEGRDVIRESRRRA